MEIVRAKEKLKIRSLSREIVDQAIDVIVSIKLSTEEREKNLRDIQNKDGIKDTRNKE